MFSKQSTSLFVKMVVNGRRLSPTRIFMLLLAVAVIGYVIYSHSADRDCCETVDMRKLLITSVLLARKGGEKLWSIRKGHTGLTNISSTVKGKTKEGANELLTKGDLESHRIMYYGLKQTFPNLKVISEEHEADEKQPAQSDLQLLDDLPPIRLLKEADEVRASDITVWIDPLDATQEYTEDLLHYVTTMVCVAVKGEPIIGIIYQPFNKEIVWGYVDHGISTNLAIWLQQRHKNTYNATIRIVVSRSHAGNVEKIVRSSIDDVLVEPAGGAGYKVIQLLKSAADAYVHTTRIKKWDICAGHAILNSVHGRMTTLAGNPITFRADEPVANDNGLLATIFKHELFLKLFQA